MLSLLNKAQEQQRAVLAGLGLVNYLLLLIGTCVREKGGFAASWVAEQENRDRGLVVHLWTFNQRPSLRPQDPGVGEVDCVGQTLQRDDY